MTHSKRAFILGAGFSKPAGMPLATELLPLLCKKLKIPEMLAWVDDLRKRLAWLSRENGPSNSFALNIEQVFHYAHFDVEVQRLKQHLPDVGRLDGPGTPWNDAESITSWLLNLEYALRDVILERDSKSKLAPITRWARVVDTQDAVLTFNYDTLTERALTKEGKSWNHGTGCQGDIGVPVYKLHGSIDWIVAHRSENFSKLDLLYDKVNVNRSNRNTGNVEDDYRLWRCQRREQLKDWIDGRDLQLVPSNASPRTVGIAGLGAYKQLHQIPGLGLVWTQGMRALYEAGVAVVAGFSMSDFDAMAQMQFAEIARKRQNEDPPLRVLVIDPDAEEKATQERFRRVFQNPKFVPKKHENFDWASIG